MMVELFNKRILILAVAAVVALSGCGGGQRNVAAAPDPMGGGLIHWWKFNGNPNDSAGNVNAVPQGPVSYTKAPTGLGIVMNGTTTGISLGPVPDMQFQQSFTISAWACLYSYANPNELWSQIIFDGDDRVGLDPYALQVDPNGNLQFLTSSTAAALSADDTTQFPLNQFVLVTGTYDKAAGIQTLYINGKPVAQNLNVFNLTPVVPLDPGANPGVGIGTNNDFPNSIYNMGWNGVISDLRVYNRAISAAEVMAIYKLGGGQ